MKKYVLKQTGQELKDGDVIVRSSVSPEGVVLQSAITRFDKDSIPHLLEEGIIQQVGVKDPEETIPTIDDCIYHLAERIKWKPENVARYLVKLGEINRFYVFSILVREFAILMDQKYPDHIENAENIYVIDGSNGKIYMVKDKSAINNYRNFAAFRTVSDAVLAKKVFAEMTKGMFNGKSKGKKRHSK